MNSLALYALGFELDEALAGSKVTAVRRLADGITIALAGAPFPYIHILYHLREPELLTSHEPLAPAENTRAELPALEGRLIKRVRPLGLERILIVDLGESGAFAAREGVRMRIDLTPAVRPLSYYDGEADRPSGSIGPRRARMPAGIEDSLPSKPFSLLEPPAALPDAVAAAASHAAAPPGAPGHTQSWRAVRSLAAALASSVAGIDPNLAGAIAHETGGDAVRSWALVVEIARRLAAGKWAWHVYRFPGASETAAVSPYPYELPLAVPGDAMPGFSAALAARASAVVIPAYIAHLRRRASRHARRDLIRLERLSTNLAGDLAEAERSSEYRHFGELLATHRHLLKAGMRTVVLKDFSGDRDVTIPLDPARSPDRNVRLYFMKAKKGEKGALIIKKRRRLVESEIERRRAEIERLESLRSPAELMPFVPRDIDRRERAATAAENRFRRIPIDEQHTAYVGRSEEENDLLTHRFASPTDLWFHAQDVPGSHVILKGAHRSTPAAVIEKAASIAAYFSKAKSSRTVPVICAEKRYVRRPRKSKPGTAVCQRGKTLFVTPELPTGGDEK